MTPEAWGFFSANSLALIALLGQSIDTRKKAREVKDTLKERDEKIDTVIQNTIPISNGAIPGLVRDVAFIKDMFISIDRRVSKIEGKCDE